MSLISSLSLSSLITVKLTNKIRLFRTFETLSERTYDVSAEPAYERELVRAGGEKVKC